MADDASFSLEPLPGHVELTCKVELGDRLRMSCALRNIHGGELMVFVVDPPFVTLRAGLITLWSAMPVIPPWSRPIAPHVPKVRALAVGSTFTIDAAYELPLEQRTPYPAAQLTSEPTPRADEVISSVTVAIGFYPKSDEAPLHLHPRGGEAPGYYELARQFLATRTIVTPPIPVRRPLWANAQG